MIYRFRHLKLDRPLVVLDAETTGTDPKTDRAVELAAVRFVPGERPANFNARLNPGVPIPAKATEVHGISDADVCDAPAFCQLVHRLDRFLAGADLAGFNLKTFDLPLLLAEYRRCGRELDLAGRRVLDAMEIYHARERRTLEAAVRLYCGKEHAHAHAALGDVIATAEVLDAQVAHYSNLPAGVGELHRVYSPVDVFGRFRLEGGRPAFAFGKHRGRQLEEVAATDPGYLRWMLEADFPADVRRLLEDALRVAAR